MKRKTKEQKNDKPIGISCFLVTASAVLLVYYIPHSCDVEIVWNIVYSIVVCEALMGCDFGLGKDWGAVETLQPRVARGTIDRRMARQFLLRKIKYFDPKRHVQFYSDVSTGKGGALIDMLFLISCRVEVTYVLLFPFNAR